MTTLNCGYIIYKCSQAECCRGIVCAVLMAKTSWSMLKCKSRFTLPNMSTEILVVKYHFLFHARTVPTNLITCIAMSILSACVFC